MDGRFEYEVAIHIAQLKKNLADAKGQYLDILSEYNTLRQNHSVAMDRMHEVEAERNALAAHVERMREGLEQALVHWGAHCTDEEGIAYAECERRCDESTTTSLARLKAEWQVGALERLRELLRETHMDKAPSASRAVMHVDDAINRVKQECRPLELRRQAEGGE